MRRSICYSEPSTLMAGERNTWKFVYTSSVSLPKGARLKFDLASKGRSIDWEIPQTNLKKTSNLIYAHLENGKILQAEEVEVPESLVPQYEFVLPSTLEAGSEVAIIMGDLKDKKGVKGENGNRSQTTAQRRKQFLLYVDPTGKGNYEDPETFTVDIRGNVLTSIRVVTPSFVVKNKRFDVIVRFEDEYGNLTNNAPEDTLVELSHEHLRENLHWKLFIPETGFIALPNLYFNEEGIYTIQLRNTLTDEIFRSAPIKCFAENSKHLFWGLLHGESERIDSTENIDSCLRHIRDEKALNFFACSPFESAEETSNDLWKHITQNIIEFDEDDRFSTFTGFQWAGINGEEGIRQIIYAKENKPLLRKKDLKSNTLEKIYRSFAPKEIISIPCFTMAERMGYNFSNFTPEFERVVEIYNAWGSSECTEEEGNTRPIHSLTKGGGVQANPKGSIQRALQNNCRFGFVAGGLDDRGIYAEFYEGDQVQYSPGLTAVIAKSHSSEAIAEALQQRSCYATTGERIILGLYIAGHPMGSEINTGEKPGLAINRHLSGYVAGTKNLVKIEIIRNGKVIKILTSKSYFLDFTYDDMTPIEKIAITPTNKQPPFVYYYIRVTQEDGHIAWSSPIWVDILPRSAAKVEKKTVVKNVKPVEIDDFEDEEDDFEDDLNDEE